MKGGALLGYGPFGHDGPEKSLSGGLDVTESPRFPSLGCPWQHVLSGVGVPPELDLDWNLELGLGRAASRGVGCSVSSRCGGWT